MAYVFDFLHMNVCTILYEYVWIFLKYVVGLTITLDC